MELLPAGAALAALLLVVFGPILVAFLIAWGQAWYYTFWRQFFHD